MAGIFAGCAGQSGPTTGGAPYAPARATIPRLTPTFPPANLGALERDAWQIVIEFGEAFSAGDATAFLSKVSSGFYRGYGTLESSLRALLDNAKASGAVVAVRKAEEEEGRISVTTEWTCSVTHRDGSVGAWSGETVFLFLKSGGSLRLLDYRGDPPFAIAGI